MRARAPRSAIRCQPSERVQRVRETEMELNRELNSALYSMKKKIKRSWQGKSIYTCSPQKEEKHTKEREIHQKVHSLASAAFCAASSALPHRGGVGIARDTRIALGVPPTIPICSRSCFPAPSLPPAPELQWGALLGHI